MIVSEAAEEILEALWIAHRGDGPRPPQALGAARDAGPCDAPGTPRRRDHRALRDGAGAAHGEGPSPRARRAPEAPTRRAAPHGPARHQGGNCCHEAACGFEHHLHRGVDANVCTLLGHPKVCPHGRPIPPGPCCGGGAEQAEQAIAPLARLNPGEGGQVAYLHTANPARAQALLSMGVTPGGHRSRSSRGTLPTSFRSARGSSPSTGSSQTPSTCGSEAERHPSPSAADPPAVRPLKLTIWAFPEMSFYIVFGRPKNAPFFHFFVASPPPFR